MAKFSSYMAFVGVLLVTFTGILRWGCECYGILPYTVPIAAGGVAIAIGYWLVAADMKHVFSAVEKLRSVKWAMAAVPIQVLFMTLEGLALSHCCENHLVFQGPAVLLVAVFTSTFRAMILGALMLVEVDSSAG